MTKKEMLRETLRLRRSALARSALWERRAGLADSPESLALMLERRDDWRRQAERLKEQLSEILSVKW